MPLTDTFLRSLKATGKIQKLSDGEGLYIHVSPTGGKLWRMAYRFEGKQKTLSFGAYPAVSLKDARRKRDEAKEKLAAGIDPSALKKAVKEAVKADATNSFEVVAREWFEKKKNKWVPHYGKKIIIRLEKDVFPFIGGRAVGSITAPELLEVLRHIEARDAVETAHRVLQNCGQIFRYAVVTGRAERDPAADLKGALTSKTSRNFPSVKDPKGVGALLRTIDGYSNLIVRSALQMAPYVFVRPGELRQAEWSEFDFKTKEWRIPAARMKMKQEHIVPLADQVIEILTALNPFTGHTRYLFPSMRTNERPISDVTLLAALRRMGYTKEEMTVHGFRSMASTLLNEKGYNRDWIERQLAHGERNSVRAAYNYAEFLPERRQMMQEWADYLDRLREGK